MASVSPDGGAAKRGVTGADKKLWISCIVIAIAFLALGFIIPEPPKSDAQRAAEAATGAALDPITMIKNFFVAGGTGMAFHSVIMVFFMWKKGKDLEKEASRVREETTFDPNGKTVLYKRKLTICQKIYFFTIGTFLGLVDTILTVIAFVGLDLKILFFPLPFYQHYKTKTLVNNMVIKGAKIRMAATYSDAYFLWLKLKRNNLLTCSCYEKRCFFMGYEKWIDKNIEWAGTIPAGFTNEFKIFSTRASLCERIQLAVLKYLFGWIPCFTPYAMMKNYKFEVSHMKIGGRTPFMSKDFNYKNMAITYIKSLCGCLRGVILGFVDKNIEFDLSAPVESAPTSPDMERGNETATATYANVEGEAAADAAAPAAAE